MSVQVVKALSVLVDEKKAKSKPTQTISGAASWDCWGLLIDKLRQIPCWFIANWRAELLACCLVLFALVSHRFGFHALCFFVASVVTCILTFPFVRLEAVCALKRSQTVSIALSLFLSAILLWPAQLIRVKTLICIFDKKHVYRQPTLRTLTSFLTGLSGPMHAYLNQITNRQMDFQTQKQLKGLFRIILNLQLIDFYHKIALTHCSRQVSEQLELDTYGINSLRQNCLNYLTQQECRKNDPNITKLFKKFEIGFIAVDNDSIVLSQCWLRACTCAVFGNIPNVGAHTSSVHVTDWFASVWVQISVQCLVSWMAWIGILYSGTNQEMQAFWIVSGFSVLLLLLVVVTASLGLKSVFILYDNVSDDVLEYVVAVSQAINRDKFATDECVQKCCISASEWMSKVFFDNEKLNECLKSFCDYHTAWYIVYEKCDGKTVVHALLPLDIGRLVFTYAAGMDFLGNLSGPLYTFSDEDCKIACG